MAPCSLVSSKRHVGEPYFIRAYGRHIYHFYFQVDNSALKKQDEYFSSRWQTYHFKQSRIQEAYNVGVGRYVSGKYFFFNPAE